MPLLAAKKEHVANRSVDLGISSFDTPVHALAQIRVGDQHLVHVLREGAPEVVGELVRGRRHLGNGPDAE